MFKHTTPPSGGSDHNEQAAEPPNSRRFADQRGIALQTIIIMVVLLAIAGAVAAVLFSRASTETARLEGSEDTFAYAVGSRLQCQSLGHTWTDGLPASADEANVKAALGTSSAFKAPTPGTTGKEHGDDDGTNYYINGYCKP